MKKTQKSFRKKALLSSLSMLMVATVAVGSATFAWFTQSPQASASGLQMKATAANGLKSKTESRQAAADGALSQEYLSTDYLRYVVDNTSGTATPASSSTSFVLTPVSMAYAKDATLPTIKAYTTTAKETFEKKADDNAVVKAATSAINQTGTEEYYQEKIFCKVVGSTDATPSVPMYLEGLTIKPTTGASDELLASVRIIISYKDKVIGGYATQAGNNNCISVVPDAGTSKYSACTTDTNVTFTAAADITTETKVSLGNVGGDGSDYVTVTAYIDGEAAGCKTESINAKDIIDSITVRLTI